MDSGGFRSGIIVSYRKLRVIVPYPETEQDIRIPIGYEIIVKQASFKENATVGSLRHKHHTDSLTTQSDQGTPNDARLRGLQGLW